MDTTFATPELDDRSRLLEMLAAQATAAPAANAQEPGPSAEGNGRDARGRFVRGNKGGRGNPFARKVARLRQALLKVVDEDQMEALARHILARALDGDMAAAKLLFSYVLGKPAEQVDPDRVDVEEWKLHQESAATIPQMRHVFFNTSVDQANSLAPIMVECAERRMEKGVREGPEAFVHELNDEEYAEYLAQTEDLPTPADRPPTSAPARSTEAPRTEAPRTEAPRTEAPRTAPPSPNGGNGSSPRTQEANRPSPNGPDGGEELNALRAALAALVRTSQNAIPQ